MKYIKWFEELDKTDTALAGGKGANLGELLLAKIPVPPGFVVLTTAYAAFLDSNDLQPKIKLILENCNVNQPSALKAASKKIQSLLADGNMPRDLSKEIIHAYDQLSEKNNASSSGIAVAVRSSATAEDSPDASFAGQQESFLNVTGDANLLLKIEECWQSLFSERSIFYRAQKGFDHFKVGIAVPVQMMVESEVSGVMFTVDPISKDKDKLIIEAAYGLGDYVVQGVVTPDHFEVSKSKDIILAKQLATQEIKEVRSRTGVKQEKVAKADQARQKLSDQKVLELAALGKRIHQHYFFPQDIEWAYAKNKLYVTQARPITTLEHPVESRHEFSLQKVLTGIPASPGLVSGPVRLIPNLKALTKAKSGDILVTDTTTTDFVPSIKRSAGIVTTSTGLTSHAALISREFGVPCIVGAQSALTNLQDGMIVTINGTSGEIFAGTVTKSQMSLLVPKSQTDYDHHVTATKVFVNLAQPDLAETLAKQHVDGIGLLQAEYILANLAVHPKKLIADGKSHEMVNHLAVEISKCCEAFSPRPVIYRASDFKTNEYRNLKGGHLYEPEETSPVMGLRGAARYIQSPEVFQLELEALKKVRTKMGHTNIWLAIPFVSTVNQLAEVKKLISLAGLYRSSTFKVLLIVETPATVVLLDDFLDVGIDGISIDTDDLTMLTLGIDKENADVAPHFTERDPAVLWMLEKAIKTAVKRGVISSISGQAPSHYPDLVDKLVHWGIGSISVNPDAISRTRETIYHAENKFITSKKNEL